MPLKPFYMKYILFLLLLISGTVYSQSTYFIRADTVRFQKSGGSTVFFLENASKAKTGAYLRNYSGGRTDFGYAMDSASLSGSNLTLWRGAGTQNIVLALPGGGGNVFAKIGSPVLKGAGDSLSLNMQYPTGLSRYNEQSSYITNLKLEQRDADAAIPWRDGHLSFFIRDTVFWVGGYNESTTTTDSIFYSVNKGVSWAAYAKKFTYAVANVASLKARYPGDWNYIFGSTNVDNTNKRTVTRFRSMDEFETMTTTAEWGNRLLYGVTRDDNGGLYLWFGQTDNQDTLTILDDAWYSSPQSGGANWGVIQSGVTGFGGCFIDQAQFVNGYHIIVNAGNKMGSGVTSVVSNKTMVLPVSESADKTKWKQVENCPVSQLFGATAVFKGFFWRFGGNDGANQNDINYLDQDFKWHTYYNTYGIDGVEISIAHASSLLNVGGELLIIAGNGNDQVNAITSADYSTPVWARESVRASTRSYFTEILNSARTLVGNGVRASTTSNDEIVRTNTEGFNSWLSMSYGAGFKFGYLTPSNSTINVPIAQGTGAIGEWRTDGMLQVGYSTSPVGTRFYNYGNAHFDGNNTDAPITMSINGSTYMLQVTGVPGQVWMITNTAVDFRIGVNNAAPTFIHSTTGTRFGSNVSPGFTVDVTGDVNATSYYIQGSQVIIQSGLNLNFGQAAGFTSSTFPGELRLGGNSSSFPMLLRSGTSLQVKLADNSAFTGLEALSLKLTGGRFQCIQGADVASVNGAIALGADGNMFELTGTNSVTLISNVDWQNGAEVILIFASTAQLTDGTANSGTDIGIELAGNVNFVGSAGSVLTLILTEIGGTQRWREKNRSVN